MAEVRLHPTAEWSYLQPEHAQVPEQPCRMLCIGPSGGGKTRLIVSLICDLWRTKSGKSIFQRIFVISPSYGSDSAWDPVVNFQRRNMKLSKDEEKYLYQSEWDEKKLERILNEQEQIIKHQKALGMSKLYGILLCVDDWADSPNIRASRVLQRLFVRGRRIGASIIASCQVLRVLHPVVRKNATCLTIFRLRNASEVETLAEEYGAVYGSGRAGREAFKAIYEEATRLPYSFLYINAIAKERQDLFWRGFTERLVIQDGEAEENPPRNK